VALDINVTDELLNEGHARELVNRIQKIRKDTGLELTDRIAVVLQRNETLENAVIQYNDYICAEVLATSLTVADEVADGIEIDVNEIVIKVSISKIA